ncbi:hypothetical protein [uncultured Dokdonia sp.]|mgnify:CR=1 FL=1|uniref:hypothetical protein n=1 Tax=uncultured Dokdonia sp. TaxID=575653 RepID=UPI002639DBF0|nr:hypothetical protein [uncultured Dokdonia sp.]
MKKNVIITLFAIIGLVASCTPPERISEETEIQLVDKTENVRPGNQGQQGG